MRFDIHLFRIREVRHVVQTIFSRAIGGGAWEALGSRSGYGAHDVVTASLLQHLLLLAIARLCDFDCTVTSLSGRIWYDPCLADS